MLGGPNTDEVTSKLWSLQVWLLSAVQTRTYSEHRGVIACHYVSLKRKSNISTFLLPYNTAVKHNATVTISSSTETLS